MSVISKVILFPWQRNSVPAGTYHLTAVATDSEGLSGTSAPLSIQVVSPLNVSLTSPINGGQMTNSVVSVSATASEAGGSITQVVFYNGSQLMGTVTQPPYNLDFKNFALGTYTMTAQATDNQGFTITSAPVTVTVIAAGQGETTGGSGGTGRPEVMYAIHSDQLNTPIVITDPSGNVVWKWDNTDPYGDNLPNQDPGNTGNEFVFNLRYPGMYGDVETGLFYNYFRDYNPATGGYLQSDPKGLYGGQASTYTYVGDNPLMYIDPLGEQGVLTVPEIGIGIGIGIYWGLTHPITPPDSNSFPGGTKGLFPADEA